MDMGISYVWFERKDRSKGVCTRLTGFETRESINFIADEVNLMLLAELQDSN